MHKALSAKWTQTKGYFQVLRVKKKKASYSSKLGRKIQKEKSTILFKNCSFNKKTCGSLGP